jgi:hypothetical protein
MTAAIIDAFVARAEARALLYLAGEIDLHEAVDQLEVAAVESGLADQIGPDRVQAIIAAAFRPVREEADGSMDDDMKEGAEQPAADGAMRDDAEDFKAAPEQERSRSCTPMCRDRSRRYRDASGCTPATTSGSKWS